MASYGTKNNFAKIDVSRLRFLWSKHSHNVSSRMNFIGLESCMQSFHKHLLCDGSNADIIALKLHDLSSGVILVTKFPTGININTDPK